MTVGFPNMFSVVGPGSPSVLSNVVVSIEHHVEWIADCLSHMTRNGMSTIEPEPAAQEAWVAHVSAVAEGTLYPQAASWYMGANIPGKPRVFLAYLGGVPEYQRHCAEVAAAGYSGFQLTPTG